MPLSFSVFFLFRCDIFIEKPQISGGSGGIYELNEDPSSPKAIVLVVEIWRTGTPDFMVFLNLGPFLLCPEPIEYFWQIFHFLFRLCSYVFRQFLWCFKCLAYFYDKGRIISDCKTYAFIHRRACFLAFRALNPVDPN
jgi:hypothetical protein